MRIRSFGLGILTVWLTGVRTLNWIDLIWSGPGDLMVTALIVDMGIGGMNTHSKYGRALHDQLS